MDRINDPSAPNARFIDADLLAGVEGTIVRALFLNGLQEELIGLIEAAGQTPDSADNTLIGRAVQIVGRRPTVFGPGSANFVVPAGVFRVRATVVGGGGAGAASNTATRGAATSSGGGGGAGGLAIGEYAVTPGQNIPVTVGAGGTGTQPGGTSSFGTFATAYGGQSGFLSDSGNSSPGGQGGGTAGGNIMNAGGGYGSDGQSNSFTSAGNGAAGPFGGSGRASAGGGAPGLAGQAPGAGGGGSYNGTGNGGAGANGIVIVEC